MDNSKIIIVTLVWTFSIGLIYMIANTMIFGYVDPAMKSIAYSSRDNLTGGYVNYERYVERTNVIKASFTIGCFILVLIPYAYLFVRLLLKKEQTAVQIVYGGGGW
jgi:hypothetical protein